MALVSGLSVSVAPDEDIGGGRPAANGGTMVPGARSSNEGAALEMTGTAMAEAVSNALDHLMGVKVL